MTRASQPSSRLTTEKRMGYLGWSILFLLTLFAFFMRFYRLDQVPPGLFYDEAFNGLDAYRQLGRALTQWPIFFTGNQGREPLFLYLLTAAHGLFGLSIWTVRSVAALAGALLIPALVWLAWEVAPALDVRARRSFALWAGVAGLGLLWSQIFARYGIRLSLFVLIEVLLWASLWKAWLRQSGGGIWWALAGFWAGLSFYTYLPSRLLPLILLPLVLVALRQHRRRIVSHWPGIVLGMVVAVIVATPLGLYFLRNPLSFTTRIDQVTVFGREAPSGGLVDNIEPVLGMFAWTGDHNPRSNLPGRPLLDPLTAVFFGVGLLVVLWRFWRLGRLFLLGGLVVMLLPTFLSEFAPNYQRAIGALPFVVLLVALGLVSLLELGIRLWPRGRPFYVGAGWLALLLVVALTWRVYFVRWANAPDLFPAWDVGFTQVAEQIVAAWPADDPGAGSNPNVRTYISPRGQEHPTLAYLLADHPEIPMPEGFDGRVCIRVATDVPARYYFLTNEDFRGEPLLHAYFPESLLRTTVTDVRGEPWADRLEQPAGGQVVFPELIPQTAKLADGIDLRGYWLYPEDGIHPGELLYTRLFWPVRTQPGHNYTAFSHLVHMDASGATTQVAGADRPPGEGTCPTTDWLPGEVVVDELQFRVPADFSPAEEGAYYLEVGFYTPEDGKRLDVIDNAEDRVLIGPLQVGTP